jgi:serine/threonine-protein kinase
MKALSPESGDLLGTIIDNRYEIGHILSIGGFATVVRARDLQADGQLCAVKLFRFEIGNEAWIRHRFDQEVMALEQLSHPSIVKITGHGATAKGAPYLVMEFIHGQNLRDLRQSGALPPSTVARFLRQISEALGTLHKAMIFHRDIKPENLMVRADEDNRQQLVLIDFSIAIVKTPEQTFHGISRVAGTLEYMAPEQVIGYADASTDIYSLAKVLMEMITGLTWANLLPEATLDLPEQVRSYLVTHQPLMSNESIDMIAAALMFDPDRRPKQVILFAQPIIRDLERAN